MAEDPNDFISRLEALMEGAPDPSEDAVEFEHDDGSLEVMLGEDGGLLYIPAALRRRAGELPS